MKKEIIKTYNYILVLDDSEIKEGDRFYLDDADIIAKYVYTLVKPDKIAKKIIFHLPLNN